MPRKKTAETKENYDESLLPLMRDIYNFLSEKKIKDIVIFDLSEVHSFFNFFIIGTAQSSTHLRSTVRQMQKDFADRMPGKRSGFRSEDLESGWIIVDFMDPIVHLFLEEQRQYYNLERLWGDAKRYSFSE